MAAKKIIYANLDRMEGREKELSQLGGDHANMQELMSVQVSLARIEESLKPLAMLPPAVSEIKDTSRDARQAATQAAQDIIEIKATLTTTKTTAEEALRQSTEALKQLSDQAESQKWFKRTFYGVFIAAAAGGIWTAFAVAFRF